MNNENSNFTILRINIFFVCLVCCFCSGVVQSAFCIRLVKSSEDELKTNHVYSSWLEFCWGSGLLLGHWAGDTLGYFPDILGPAHFVFLQWIPLFCEVIIWLLAKHLYPCSSHSSSPSSQTKIWVEGQLKLQIEYEIIFDGSSVSLPNCWKCLGSDP